MSRGRRVLIVAAAAGVSACMALLNPPEVSFVQGDASADAMGDVDTGALDLISNPSFAEGTGGCGTDWQVIGGLISRSDAGRTDGFACRLCPDPARNTFALLEPLRLAKAQPGASYVGEAWARADDPGPPSMGGELFGYLADGGLYVRYGSNVGVSSEWEKITITSVVPEDGRSVSIRIAAEFRPDAAGCVLVDDVALYTQ